jgi:hypothetical protein
MNNSPYIVHQQYLELRLEPWLPLRFMPMVTIISTTGASYFQKIHGKQSMMSRKLVLTLKK